MDPLKVLKEGKVAKARVVACLEKFHEAAVDLRRKTKEMTITLDKLVWTMWSGLLLN